MKANLTYFSISLLIIISATFSGCDKEEYFKSEKGTQKELQGSWNLVPIPKYEYDLAGNKTLRQESWTFDDNSHLTISKNGYVITGAFSISTSLMKVKIKVDNLSTQTEFYGGTWQVVKLNKNYLIIANDHDGATGLSELEFQRLN